MLWLLMLIVLLGLSFPVEAAVLCAPKKGTGAVFVRETCKKNERQLDPAALGLRGPGAIVKDSRGTLVGMVLDRGELDLSRGLLSVNVLLEVTGDVIEMQVSSTGFAQD